MIGVRDWTGYTFPLGQLLERPFCPTPPAPPQVEQGGDRAAVGNHAASPETPKPAARAMLSVSAAQPAQQPKDQDKEWLTAAMLVQMIIVLGLLVAVPGKITTAVLLEHLVVVGIGALLFLKPARRLGKVLLLVGSLPLLPALPFALPLFLGR